MGKVEGRARMTEAGAGSGVVGVIQDLIEWAALGIEVLAVARARRGSHVVRH